MYNKPFEKKEYIIDNSKPLLSICISLKNRSRIVYGDKELNLFPRCVERVSKCAESLGIIELVIADYSSDDWQLNEWIDEFSLNLKLQVINMNDPFSRGEGLNTAVKMAESDRIFICDADMLVNVNTLQKGIDMIDQGKAWFPICQFLDETGKYSHWLDAGYGFSFLSKNLFDQVGGIPEFKSWGGEDDLFYDRVNKEVTTVHERCNGLIHQWHPEYCRHENYINEKRSDYKTHIKNKEKLNNDEQN